MILKGRNNDIIFEASLLWCFFYVVFHVLASGHLLIMGAWQIKSKECKAETSGVNTEITQNEL
jgi:hypothetical protein